MHRCRAMREKRQGTKKNQAVNGYYSCKPKIRVKMSVAGGPERSLDVAPRPINIGVQIVVDFSHGACLHKPRKLVHVDCGGIANLLVVPARWVNSFISVPCDIGARPATVEVYIVQEGPPQGVQREHLRVPNNNQKRLSSSNSDL